MRVKVTTSNGLKKTLNIKAGRVGKTLVSADKLCEGGYEITLYKTNPRMVKLDGSETIPLKRSKGMFLIDLWIQVPNARTNDGNDYGGPSHMDIDMAYQSPFYRPE